MSYDYKSTDIDIYRLYKDEIKREDEIVHQRSTAALTFHGLLFTSMTFLLSNPWFKDNVRPDTYPFRVIILAILGYVGFAIAILSAAGIMAANASIREVSGKYNLLEDKNPNWPQLHGSSGKFQIGSLFAVSMHVMLAANWALYEAILGWFVLQWQPIAAISVLVVMLLVLLWAIVWTKRHLNKNVSNKNDDLVLASKPAEHGQNDQ